MSPGRREAAALLATLVAVAATFGACSSTPAPDAAAASTSAVAVVAPDGSIFLPTFDTASGELGECAQIGIAFSNAYNQITLLSGGGTTEEFARARAEFDDLEDRVPTELQEPFSVVHRAVIDFAEGASTADLDTAEGVRALSEAGERLDTPVVHQAVERINEWFVVRCQEPDTTARR